MARPLVSALTFVFAASVGIAGTITQYTSQSTFTTAVGSATVETFGTKDCFPLGVPINSTTSTTCSDTGGSLTPGTLQPGATYSATKMSATVTNFNIDSGGGFSSQFLDALGAPNSLMVTFAGPVAAFGFNTTSLMGTSFSITINFSSGPADIISGISIPSGEPFFGFQSSAQDITSISVTGSNGLAAFDNFTFSATGIGGTGTPPAVTPAPPSWMLLLIGLAALGIMSQAYRWGSKRV